MIQRSRYCESNQLPQKQQVWLEACQTYQPQRKVVFRKDVAALILLDMQRYFLEESSHAFVPQAPELLDPLVRLQREFLKQNRLVVQTIHVDLRGASPMRRWWQQTLEENHPACDLHPLLEDPRSIRLKKTAYSAFFGTPLESLLVENRIEQVVVGGVLTHLCCETTIRDAFMRGFEVLMLIDGMATSTEALHVGSLRALAHGFASPCTCDDVLAQLEACSCAAGVPCPKPC